jgi:hypothetical protein
MVGQQDLEALRAALAAPFAPAEVRFRPATIRGHRALAVPSLDVRTVMDRLDRVLGLAGWQDEYEALADGGVICRLKVRLHGQWLVRSDLGAPRDLPSAAQRRKAAFSDALRRAAVKWGIGRYLRRVPPRWVDYDPATGQFVFPPVIPDSKE